VPQRHVEGGFDLGTWVTYQRSYKLQKDVEQRLKAIGFVWDARDHAWEKAFGALVTFKSREGHCRVALRHIEGTVRLGQWVAHQRERPDAMSPERRQRLNTIGFTWSALDEAWEKAFAALMKFRAREGHCRVPRPHLEDKFDLAGWVKTQRRNRVAMSPDRKQRLDTIGFLWNVLEANWEEGFSALAAYKARVGHCDVPARHVEGEYKLRQWINEQRTNSSSLLPERRKRLDAIGFVWSVREMEWEEGFSALSSFKAREGHCKVPQKQVEGGFRLGGWVSIQRGSKDTMSAERKQRLDALGFVWRVKLPQQESRRASMSGYD
jgi:hypothetical protein